jgi:septal ring factor EnvC (AmiA/AmiB activator)
VDLRGQHQLFLIFVSSQQAQLEEAYEEVLQSNEQLKADGDSLRQTLKEYERLAQLRDADQKETTVRETETEADRQTETMCVSVCVSVSV